MDLWPPQQRGLDETKAHLEAGKDVCYYAPTGGGKTKVAIELLKWASEQGSAASFYCNRKLLLAQTAEKFAAAGLPFGIRAAGYDQDRNITAPFQICSADTERSRVLQRKTWGLHRSQRVIIDELHLNKRDTMQTLVSMHKALTGALIVGMTATPIGVAHMADELVVSGTMKEYRECNAIVPAKVFSFPQPDMSKVKRNASGEFILHAEKKRIYTQTIVADVFRGWSGHNPDARPTFLYAPGVKESVWFTEQFVKRGVPWAHIDANDGVVDGQRVRRTPELWAEILERFRDGDIKGISSRFVLREGIDVPFAYHAIIATPIGSLASYIQCIGRVLRWSEATPEHVIVTDHGGAYWLHGSPNATRPWKDWWGLSEGIVSRDFHAQIRNRETAEPIRCPKCGLERLSGITCPNCQFTHQKSSRQVIMANGKLREVEGPLLKPKIPKRFPDTQRLWDAIYHGYCRRNSRKPPVEQTFAQAEAHFFRTNFYWPPRDLRNMPVDSRMWHQKVYAVPREYLY